MHVKNTHDAYTLRGAPPAGLIPGKLLPPQQHCSVVARPELLHLLDTGRERRVTLLLASAGYGKTTLAAQWRNRLLVRGVKVAWLTLDEEDRETELFIASLAGALAQAGVDSGRLIKTACQGFAEVSVTAAIAAVVAAIAADPVPVVVILDDFHRVGDAPTIARLMQVLVTHTPANLHLVLATRVRPAGCWADLRARGELAEITSEDLRLSCEHVRRMLPAGVSRATVESLVQRTEGWPAAVQLARSWLGADARRVEQIERFCGRVSDVAEYLAEQVLAGLPPLTCEFLLQTSILERVNGDLANAVCRRDDAWRILEEVNRICSLVLPLDDERLWYRYHHLFAEYLQERLRREGGSGGSELHARASDWFADHGFLGDAVRHAALAGDPVRAAGLIEDAGGWELVLLEGAGTVRNLLKHVDVDVDGFPRLQLCRVHLRSKAGDLAAAREEYERLRVRTGNFRWIDGKAVPGLQRDGALVGLLLSGYEDRLVGATETERLGRMLEKTSARDYRALGIIFTGRCVNSLGRGELKTVAYAARQARRHLERAGSPLGCTYTYFHQGLSALFRGRLHEAEKTYRKALSMAEELFGAESAPKAHANVLLAEVLYQKNELDAATERLDESLSYVEDYDGWVDIYASGYQTAVAVALTRRDFGVALDAVTRGEQTALTRRLERLQAIMEAVRVRVLTAAGDLRAAQRLGDDLEAAFSSGDWREDRARWRQHLAGGLALADLALARERPAAAVAVLDRLEACCTALGCEYYRIEVLTLRALARRLAGRAREAVSDMHAALGSAASQGLRRMFLDRGRDLQALLRAVEEGRNGVTAEVRAFTEDLRRCWYGNGAASLAEPITARELDVLMLLGRGYANKTIARTLGIGENTVKFHLKNIYTKLGVERRREAVDVARERAIID